MDDSMKPKVNRGRYFLNFTLKNNIFQTTNFAKVSEYVIRKQIREQYSNALMKKYQNLSSKSEGTHINWYIYTRRKNALPQLTSSDAFKHKKR